MISYEVDAKLTVEYLDPDDMTGQGIKSYRKGVQGSVLAEDRKEAKRMVKQFARAHVGPCWSIKFDIRLTPNV